METWAKEVFDVDCRQCSRLANFLDEVKHDHPDYHARPVAPFGTKQPKLLVVGLAPGMHGANATGRPFTGDYAVFFFMNLYINSALAINLNQFHLMMV